MFTEKRRNRRCTRKNHNSISNNFHLNLFYENSKNRKRHSIIYRGIQDEHLKIKTLPLFTTYIYSAKMRNEYYMKLK
jgi:hypothetical protein